ncbi:MAG: ATP synthase subunit I [Acidimicrobiia bacterium]
MSAPAQDLSPQDVPVEREIAFDIVRRGALAAPVLVLVGAAIWGADGAASVGYGIGIVLVNLVLSALMLAWAARRSPAWLMGTALGGFMLRMGLATLAIVVVRDQAWVELVPLAIAVLVASLGLVFWETRYVSASLAFPGLKPSSKGA